ncbi:MAG: ABC transporter ATP-binding protein [Actinobacteria bacterium]|nr:ABC transporter ATP-binding protein [Actinomycetota bacterium]
MANPAEGAASRSLDRTLMRRVATYARPYGTKLIGFVVTIVLEALLALAPPFLFKAIIDNAIPERDTTLLTILAGLVVGAAVASALLGLFERWWSAAIGEGLIYDLRRQLYDHVQRLPLGFFTRTQTGSLVSRLNNDVIGAQRAFTGTLGTVVSNIITVAVTLAAMAKLEWRLTIASVLLLPLFIWPARRVGTKLAGITREGMQHNAEMNSIMTERFGVSGAMVVKTYGDEGRELERFAARASKVRDIGIHSAMLTRVFMAVMGLVGAVGTAAIYWWGGHQVIDGAITLGTLTALAALVVRIYEPLTGLTNARVDVMSALVSFERVFEILDAPTTIHDPIEPAPLLPVSGRIELDHVSFRYPTSGNAQIASLEGDFGPQRKEDQVVLHDLNATIEPGQMVAIVGPSGAGKSTLTSLVTRLYDVTDGAIRIDGKDVRDVALLDLRAAIGVVAQDPHMFHTTVAENLRFARPDATDDDLRRAAEAAHVLEVIQRLPDGFDTVVGERGYRLSGGEKQRLAIARMLLKDPAIVILDEATSHLDAENEHLVQLALADALKGRTSLVVAHRLSTIIDADVILVMNDGAIVQRGTHHDLVATEGLYRELYSTLVRDQHQSVDEPIA